jgi:hypothetical protein
VNVFGNDRLDVGCRLVGLKRKDNFRRKVNQKMRNSSSDREKEAGQIGTENWAVEPSHMTSS